MDVPQYQISRESVQWGGGWYELDGKTDGQTGRPTDVTKLKGTFRDSTELPLLFCQVNHSQFHGECEVY